MIAELYLKFVARAGLVFLVISGNAEAADGTFLSGGSSVVVGKVVSTANNPIEGYPVIITTREDWSAEGAAGVVTFTDPEGNFRVQGLGGGEYVAIPGTQPKDSQGFEVEAPSNAGRRIWERAVRQDVDQGGNDVGSVILLQEFMIPTGPVGP